MSEVDALLKVASAINALSVSVYWIGVALWAMLIFKDMGVGARDELRKRRDP